MHPPGTPSVDQGDRMLFLISDNFRLYEYVLSVRTRSQKTIEFCPCKNAMRLCVGWCYSGESLSGFSLAMALFFFFETGCPLVVSL